MTPFTCYVVIPAIMGLIGGLLAPYITRLLERPAPNGPYMPFAPPNNPNQWREVDLLCSPEDPPIWSHRERYEIPSVVLHCGKYYVRIAGRFD